LEAASTDQTAANEQLIAQLRAGVASLDTKQPESVIGNFHLILNVINIS